MYQQIELVGSLGDDPDLRYTRDGTAVTSFRVETNRRWRAQDGTTREKRVWFRVTAWRRLAERCDQYLSQGQRVAVVGRMDEPRTWTDEEGNARASLEVEARNVRFLSTLEEAQALSPGPDLPGEGGEGEEIPF